jgi:hypothetical protein
MLKMWKRVQIFRNNTNKSNFFLKEIKNRLNLENACDHSVQNALDVHLLSKEEAMKVFSTQPIRSLGSCCGGTASALDRWVHFTT